MVQSADDVQFGRPFAVRFGGALDDLLVAHDVAARAFEIGPESAEGAAVDANVGPAQMFVDVVIGVVAVLALADAIGQFAEREQVRVLFKQYAVVEGEPLGRLHFFAGRATPPTSRRSRHVGSSTAEVLIL